MKYWRGSVVLTALIAAVLAGGAVAEDDWAPEEMTGVKVGEKAPDFTLANFDGTKVTLSELTKKGTVALVFYRSANW